MSVSHAVRHSRAWLLLVALIASLTLVVAAPTPAATLPPAIPSASTAQSQLNALTVRTEGSLTGYSRDLFPHWSTVSGACNTRETVLRRDGSGVVVNSSCAVTDNSNQSKSDRDPAAWRPTRTSFHCTYARMWIGAKYTWSLTLQSTEKSALQSMLNTC